ncbi:unnamed protein product [Amoebophrya sp. A120]|nr:unnamed protein product [Amoebophrya sp. A120]|eukprot:GSA120T00005846001.1
MILHEDHLHHGRRRSIEPPSPPAAPRAMTLAAHQMSDVVRSSLKMTFSKSGSFARPCRKRRCCGTLRPLPKSTRNASWPGWSAWAERTSRRNGMHLPATTAN